MSQKRVIMIAATLKLGLSGVVSCPYNHSRSKERDFLVLFKKGDGLWHKQRKSGSVYF